MGQSVESKTYLRAGLYTRKAKVQASSEALWGRGAALGSLEGQGSVPLSQQRWAELFRPELSWKGQVKMKIFIYISLTKANASHTLIKCASLSKCYC